MFTLPLDDFVAPIVADDTRRDNIPGYHRDKIFIIEEDDGEAEYRVKRLTGSEWYELDEKGGDLRPKDSDLNGNELEGFVAEEDKWRGSDGFYIYRTTRPRRSPQVYLLEYKRILEYLPKLSNHDFIWLTSMADLVLDDFKDVADDTRGYKTVETSGESDESIRFNEETSEIKVGRSDIDPEMIKDLFNIDKDWSPRLRSNVSEYRVFSEWVKQEYLFAEEPKLKKWMEDKTKENYVFPVWFDIDDEGENRFSTQSPEVLNGSQYLTDRLRGDHLGRHYPNGRLGQVRERLPFTDTEGYPSKSEMAYRVLRHRRHSGE
jgi:hypothetical protein